MPTFPERLCRSFGQDGVAPFSKERTCTVVQGDDGEEMKCSMSMPVVALLVPFVPPQTDALVRSIHLWSHPNYYPCEVSFTYAQHVDLVFQLTESFARHASVRHRLEDALRPVLQCFRSVRFLSMNLDEAQRQYDKNRFSPSPSTMFHTLFGSEMMVKSYSHFFLMEPDVRPVRGGWVDRLVQEVTLDLVDFWQKGSMEYNHPHADHHLNGNGLYRLGSSDYNCFLEAVLALRYPDSFDQGQFIIMQQPDKIHQQHRSIKSTYIMNIQDAYYEGFEADQPNTFLVHGKVVVSQLEQKNKVFLDSFSPTP